MNRCPWAENSAEEADYHDDEWGVPVHDDRRLFEMLTLEGAQAGLSWRTILNKRSGYRAAFCGFDADKVAHFTQAQVEKLLGDASIVRHRGKIEATIGNAQAILQLRQSGVSLDLLLWSFVDGTPAQNHRRRHADIPAETPVSRAMSKELKRRGFRFVGPTTCYAFMQAAGLVNDHLVDCPWHDLLAESARSAR